MSSHHVIRENQEPALLVQDFHALDLESIGQLLEWSPTIIANNDSVDNLLMEEIKVDVVFSKEELPALQEHTKVISFEESFVYEALNYLIKENHKAVNILSNYLPEHLNSFAEEINIVLFYDQKRFVLVQDNFEKWKPKGDLVYVDEKYLKSFQGVNYISKGIFETIQEGFVQLEFNTTDFVLLGEEI